MDISLTWFPNHNNWVEGIIDEHRFQAKLYDEPSEYGINDGRVSKLWVQGILNYDRGWDFGKDNAYVSPLVDFLEATPKRFDGWGDKRIPIQEYYKR